MKADLICTVSNNYYMTLKNDSIMCIDLYTKEFDDIETLCSSSEFSDRIGTFIYDNSQEIEEELVTQFFIRYKLDKEDVSNLKFFISDITNEKTVHLPVVFKTNFKSENEMEEFIRENAFLYGSFFLKKFRTSSKRYLYLRIYYSYIQRRIDKKLSVKRI